MKDRFKSLTRQLALAALLALPAGLFAQSEAGLTISSTTQTLPEYATLTVSDGVVYAYGVKDDAGIAAGLPSSFTISVVNDQSGTNASSTYGYNYTRDLVYPEVSSIGDLMATITVSATNTKGRAVGVYVSNYLDSSSSAMLQINEIGGSVYVNANCETAGLDLRQTNVRLISADIVVSGPTEVNLGMYALIGTTVGEYSGNMTVSGGLAASGIGNGIKLDALSGHVYVQAANAIGMDLGYQDQVHISGSVRAVAEHEQGGFLASAIYTESKTLQVNLADGAVLSAVNSTTGTMAFAVVTGTADSLVRLSGENASATLNITGGLLSTTDTATVSIETGTYLWNNLHTLQSGEMGTGTLSVTVTSDAKVVLLDDASLNNERFTVNGELALTAQTLTDFSQVTLDGGVTFSGEGKITLVLDDLFTATDGQQMQLFVLGSVMTGVELMDTFSVLWKNGDALEQEKWSFDADAGILTFHGDIPEPAAAAALLGLLALMAVARRR